MTLKGKGVQYNDPDCNTFSNGAWMRALCPNLPPPMLVFKYDNRTGEPIYPLCLDVWDRGDSELGSDSDLDSESDSELESDLDE